jgi:hypothetical protein
VDAGIVRVYPQVRRAPTRNSSVLAEYPAGGRKGDGGGWRGVFIGRARGRNGQALIGIEEGSNGGRCQVQRERERSVEKKLPTGGSHRAARERGKSVPIRRNPGWAAGRKLDWAGLFPLGLFIYFSFPFFFSFLFS